MFNIENDMPEPLKGRIGLAVIFLEFDNFLMSCVFSHVAATDITRVN